MDKSARNKQPSPAGWIVQTSDILQVQFRSVSVVQPPRGLPHGLESRCTDSGRDAHKQTIPSTIFHDPWVPDSQPHFRARCVARGACYDVTNPLGRFVNMADL